jgi:hypothetical protein
MNGGEIWLCQDLQNALGLQVANGGSQAVIKVEIEQVQEVADDCGIRATLALVGGRAELPGRRRSAVLAQAEEVDSKLGQLERLISAMRTCNCTCGR